MKDVMDYAKFFLKNEDKNISNTFDGNMKLQKLFISRFTQYVHPGRKISLMHHTSLNLLSFTGTGGI